MSLSQTVIRDLTATLRSRRINDGIAALERVESDLSDIRPDVPHAGQLLLLIAQWIDVGFRNAQFLAFLLNRFTMEIRKKQCLEDYLYLRMAGGFCALASGNSDEAIRILDLVLGSLEDIDDKDQMALAHFWKGRAHRKKGEYELSLTHIVRARELSQAREDKMFSAIIGIQESWLLFQKGLTRQALRGLDRAEAVLKTTDHYIALGNIESARGRIVRRSGDYSSALKYFASASHLYEKRDSQHPNHARSLVNAAYVRRILALQIGKRIDRAQRSGKPLAPDRSKPGQSSSESLRSRYQRLCREAMQNLNRAREIYSFHGNEDGIGNVTLNLGYLHLDRGEIDRASQEADVAYQIGLRRKDHLLMARARILGAAGENAHVDEQTGENDDAAIHANRARDWSDEALALARGTQNRRLLAGAYIVSGMTAANEFYQDWELARKCASEATAMIVPGESDQLVEALSDLKSRIVQASGINDTLRAWSEGMVGNKTFRQVAEEFAEIVIPKVWLRDDKKIARVAQQLSISPKKVRRILRNTGWQ